MKNLLLASALLCLCTSMNSHSMEGGDNRFEFNIPPLRVEWPQHSVPFEITIAPSTLVALAGSWGAYQSVNLLKEGIQKKASCEKDKQEEGKKLITYGSILLCGSVVAMLNKSIFGK